MEGVRWWAKWVRELDRRVEAVDMARALGGGGIVSGVLRWRGEGQGRGGERTRLVRRRRLRCRYLRRRLLLCESKMSASLNSYCQAGFEMEWVIQRASSENAGSHTSP